MIASAIGAGQTGERDAGWAYFQTHPPAVAGKGPIEESGFRVLGRYPEVGAGHLMTYPSFKAELWAYVLEPQ